MVGWSDRPSNHTCCAVRARKEDRRGATNKVKGKEEGTKTTRKIDAHDTYKKFRTPITLPTRPPPSFTPGSGGNDFIFRQLLALSFPSVSAQQQQSHEQKEQLQTGVTTK